MATLATRAAPAPSPQEIQRKLSTSRPSKVKPPTPISTFSGAESDSDSVFSPDAAAPSSLSLSTGAFFSPTSQTPLSAIAERRTASGEETDEDEEEDEGWRVANTNKLAAGKDAVAHDRDAQQQEVRKAGYLWKKGIRRKTWKKRWFVLRFSHLAYYKSSAEYKLLRLLDIHEVHAVTACSLKRHEHTFGIVTPNRTFYLQAEKEADMLDWVQALNEIRVALLSTASVNSLPAAAGAASLPITIPRNTAAAASTRTGASPLTVSPPSRLHIQNVTSSDSDEPSPTTQQQHQQQQQQSTSVGQASSQDPSKPVLSGYLMKCSQNRRNWRKRWFTLTGEKLVYTTSHMDTRPHRVILLTQIVDALEVEVAVPAGKYNALAPSPSMAGSPSGPSLHAGGASAGSGAGGEDADGAAHTFKVITPKRTLLLCAPSEEEEIRWLSAIRALIARRSGTVALSLSPSGGVPPAPALGDGTARRPGRRLSGAELH